MEDFERLLKEAKQSGYNIGACVRISNPEGLVLLVRRAKNDFFGNIWEIPGGAVDPGEDVKQAAAREVYEETGLKIKTEQLQYLTYFEFNNIETKMLKLKFVFSVTVKGDVAVSHEHSDFKWATLKEISKMKLQSKHEQYELWDDHYNAIMFQTT